MNGTSKKFGFDLTEKPGTAGDGRLNGYDLTIRTDLETMASSRAVSTNSDLSENDSWLISVHAGPEVISARININPQNFIVF